MEKKPPAAEAAGQPRDTTAAREPARPGRAVFAAEGAREKRVSEPAVATDGQLVEDGYGHGV